MKKIFIYLTSTFLFFSDKEKFVDLSDMPPLEGNEEVKEWKGLKAEKNSWKSKNEIRQILYLLYQHNKITKKVYNNLIKSL